MKGVWHVNRALYDWWKKKIFEGAKVGHRYNCLMVLTTFAMKCSMYDPKHNPNPVTYKELEKDCFEFLEYLEGLTDDENNHFTEGDVLDALQLYKNSYINYPRVAVEYRSGIAVPPNKRNGRSQELHLRIARSNKAILKDAGELARDGRPSKGDAVLAYLRSHPDDTVTQIAKALSVSRPTVYKYKRMIENGEE